MKKCVSMVVVCLLILFCFIFGGLSACESRENDGTNHIDINLDEMDVGEKVYSGDLVYEKAPENTPIFPSTRATTEGFTVTDFGGNTSMNKVLALNNTCGYFRILVNNKGTEKMKADIGGEHTASISPGLLYVYSAEAWKEKSYTVSFSCDTGLYGSAHAMLYSSPEEVNP